MYNMSMGYVCKSQCFQFRACPAFPVSWVRDSVLSCIGSHVDKQTSKKKLFKVTQYTDYTMWYVFLLIVATGGRDWIKENVFKLRGVQSNEYPRCSIAPANPRSNHLIAKRFIPNVPWVNSTLPCVFGIISWTACAEVAFFGRYPDPLNSSQKL